MKKKKSLGRFSKHTDFAAHNHNVSYTVSGGNYSRGNITHNDSSIRDVKMDVTESDMSVSKDYFDQQFRN